jgi:plastocyanin
LEDYALMPRRITVLLAAVVGVALCAFMVGTAGAAPAKKKLTILGKTTFKPGQFAKDTQRFTPKNLTVSPGDKVVLRNKAKTQDPHTISLVRKRQLPDSFECPACDAIFAAHGEDPNTGEPANAVVDVGDPGFDQPGDSIFIPPGPPGKQKITIDISADAGTNLFYLCAIHPWMQGKFRVR